MTHGMSMKPLFAQIPITILCLIIAGLAQTRMAVAQAPLQNALGDQNIASFWTYDNLDLGIKRARETGKPLLVTIRCVPCHACRGMDQKVVNPTDLQLLTLMNQFVCVRIVQAWGLDLSLFQYDMNQSWAAFFMNADGVIYGRYGTRAAQRDETAITIEGFSKALDGAVDLHRRYLIEPTKVKADLSGKIGPKPRWEKPDDIPVIQNTVRWGKPIGRMTDSKQTECLHCHFVPAADMMSMLDAGDPITDQTLWAYPLPETVGWTLDPSEKATITKVAMGTQAEKAGFQAGDAIIEIEQQAIISIADVQWILHQAGEVDSLSVEIKRNDKQISIELPLETGWRRRDEFASRVSSWDFFKVKLFGVNQLESLSDSESAELEIAKEQTALRIVKLAPSWGGMNQDVRKAGLKEGDIIVQVDEQKTLSNHSEILAYLVQKKRSGDHLNLVVLREGIRTKISVPLDWSNRLQALRKP
jgi:serine protease Do